MSPLFLTICNDTEPGLCGEEGVLMSNVKKLQVIDFWWRIYIGTKDYNDTAQKLFIANIIDPLHDKYLSISIMILDQSRSVESTHSVDRCEEQG